MKRCYHSKFLPRSISNTASKTQILIAGPPFSLHVSSLRKLPTILPPSLQWSLNMRHHQTPTPFEAGALKHLHQSIILRRWAPTVFSFCLSCFLQAFFLTQLKFSIESPGSLAQAIATSLQQTKRKTFRSQTSNKMNTCKAEPGRSSEKGKLRRKPISKKESEDWRCTCTQS